MDEVIVFSLVEVDVVVGPIVLRKSNGASMDEYCAKLFSASTS